MANSTLTTLPLNQIVLGAVHRVDFEEDGLHLMARAGANTTAISCPAYSSLPVGLRFTLDNSRGSGDMTLTPTAGTPIVANAGEVWDCLVAANGSIRAGELAAAPTS